MFYRMIEQKRDKWFQSKECTVRALVDYIVNTGHMRDAQVEAIKTYLFLKIACDCKPLHELFSTGTFNTLNIGELSLPDSVKEFLRKNQKPFWTHIETLFTRTAQPQNWEYTAGRFPSWRKLYTP